MSLPTHSGLEVNKSATAQLCTDAVELQRPENCSSDQSPLTLPRTSGRLSSSSNVRVSPRTATAALNNTKLGSADACCNTSSKLIEAASLWRSSAVSTAWGACRTVATSTHNK